MPFLSISFATSPDKATVDSFLQFLSPLNCSYCCQRRDLCKTSIGSPVAPANSSVATYCSQDKTQDINTTYFLSYFPFYTTAILNFFQLPTKVAFSCSVGLCTYSFLCLIHLPATCLCLLQKAIPSYSSGLISDVTSSRRLVWGWGEEQAG